MNKLYGCTVKPVADCLSLLAWVRGAGADCSVAANTGWLLAHCDDGVVWGKRETSQMQWTLSSVPFPDISPLLSAENLQQIRIFGSRREILIWRTEDGFGGRILTDTDEMLERPLRPMVEEHILVGDRLLSGSRAGFSLVGDARGARHAVPLVCQENTFKKRSWPLRMTVKHYLIQENDTGIVRIAASRLVNVKNVAM